MKSWCAFTLVKIAWLMLLRVPLQQRVLVVFRWSSCRKHGRTTEKSSRAGRDLVPLLWIRLRTNYSLGVSSPVLIRISSSFDDQNTFENNHLDCKRWSISGIQRRTNWDEADIHTRNSGMLRNFSTVRSLKGSIWLPKVNIMSIFCDVC